MTTAPRPPRWPYKAPTPALAELREVTATLPELCYLGGVDRYRAAAALVATLPRILRSVRDEAAIMALKGEGMTYEAFADAVGLTNSSVNKRVSSHNARTRDGQS